MRPDDFAIDSCLKCTLCNAACPVFGVYPPYPGPKHLGPELERLRCEGISTDTPWVEYCLGCHRCDLACPNQVNVSEMIARAKATHRKPLIRGLRDWWFARPGLLGKLTTILPALSNFALRLKPVRFLMSTFMQITPGRVFPSYTKPNLRSRPADGMNQRSVVFFPGCYIRYNRPDLGRKVLEVLARNGIHAEVAETECCGVPAMANGDAALARLLAGANTVHLASHVNEGRSIVAACSSCGHALKTGFNGLLEGDKDLAAAAQKVAANSFDLGEFLMALSDAGQLDTGFLQTDLRLAYHAPCHQRSQGMGRPWYHLLRKIPGVVVEDLNAGCCGMSGTYGFKQEKYEVSMAIAENLFKSIETAHPHAVVTECATCQMQIEHGANAKAIHPVEILLRAYGA